MTTKPLDIAKPIKCRDGVVPTIYCTDAPGDYPIHGRVCGFYEPLAWDLMGQIEISENPKHQWNLINVPEPLVVWLDIYMIDGKPFVLVGSEEPPCSSTFQKPIGRKRIVIKNPEGFDDE